MRSRSILWGIVVDAAMIGSADMMSFGSGFGVWWMGRYAPLNAAD